MYKFRDIQFRTDIAVLPCEILKDFGTFYLPICHLYNIFFVLKVQNYGMYGPGSMTKLERKKGQRMYQKGDSQKLSQDTFTYLPLANDLVIPNCNGSYKCSYIEGSQYKFFYSGRERRQILEKNQQSLSYLFLSLLFFF